MKLTKEQLVNNLIKYNVISTKELKKFSAARRTTLIKLMNEYLPKNIIDKIYEDEYFMNSNEKDYSPISNFNPYSTTSLKVDNNKINTKSFIKLDESIFKNKNDIDNKNNISSKEDKDIKKMPIADLLSQGKLKTISMTNHRKELKTMITDKNVQQILDKIEEFY